MLKKLLTILLITLFMQSFASAETVVFNVETKIIHSICCPSAKKCTKSCIKIDRKEAVKRGGVPCQKCGG